MELSRRNFLNVAAVAGLASVGALARARTARADEASEAGAITYDQTIAWDGQYDVVVVGFGAAGAAAAISASDNGANVLVVEKAPLGNEGGNSRYCGQLFINGHGDYDQTLYYYQQLAGDLEIDEETLAFYAEGIANIEDTYAELFGLDKEEFVDATAANGWSDDGSPEYPEFATNEETKPTMSLLHNAYFDAYMWQNYRQQVVNRSDSIDVWLESPAVSLIQEPNTKTILGVVVERAGEQLNIRATNGVVLSCGGYENNRGMLEDYLGLGSSTFAGTTYNTGDGIRMAQAVGADLWHMHVWEGPSAYGTYTFVVEDGERGSSNTRPSESYAYMVVGGDGYRFFNETEYARHGHYYNNGVWSMPNWPAKEWFIFDEQNASILDTYTAKSEVVSADTITELAEIIGTKDGVLEQTIADFNSFSEAGYDPVCHRDAAYMQAFGDGPYYAMQVIPYMLNTQGGPRRNASAEILGTDGDPIPHLYGAGECGGITSNMYQGGGNMAECLIFGLKAGESAAEQKDALDAYVVEAVESELVYTIGVANDLADEETDDSDLGENEYLASATGIGGEIVIKLTTLDGVNILALEVIEEYETDSIGGAALEVLVPAILEAGNIDGIEAVSGATVTSTALFEAIEDALAQAQAANE